MLDGGFVTKKLSVSLKRFPTGSDVETESRRVCSHPALAGFDLLRIYFYDAPPASDRLTNPIDGSTLDLGRTPIFAGHSSLLDKLELTPNFAIRRGDTQVTGWKVGDKALRHMLKVPRAPTAGDLVPAISQKGVDLRIGLDIARLALREHVRAIVVVTGDSDLVPAFKFARREGIRVYLDHMGHGVRRELKAHADLVL